jgi:hypothetical protein
MIFEKMWSHNLQNLALLATVGLFPCGTVLRTGEGKVIAVGETKIVKLTPWSWVFREKPPVTQLLKKFPNILQNPEYYVHKSPPL